MNKILKKEQIAPMVTRYVVEAPGIAKKRKAGQFVILRINETGERIPLTIADADPVRGTITLVVQEVGKTTALLASCREGFELADVVGPLGTPTHIEKYGTVVCVGGGIGIAPLHPIAQALKKAGNHVITILGARCSDLLIMQDQMEAASDRLLICTDDGTCGERGFVSHILQKLIDSRIQIDLVVAIGPPIMMKVTCDVTRENKIPTVVSLNSIMVDATGMCGACRVSVGGTTKFVCVDGPEFDGHQVDFSELMARLTAYREWEKVSYDGFRDSHKGCCS
jgi:ferredoxin--NADP+ reductase